MGRKPREDKVTTLLGDDRDDATAATADETELPDDITEPDSDDDDYNEAEFNEENAPKPPPEKLLFGGEGKSAHARGQSRSKASLQQAREAAAPTNGRKTTEQCWQQEQRQREGDGDRGATERQHSRRRWDRRHAMGRFDYHQRQPHHRPLPQRH